MKRKVDFETYMKAREGVDRAFRVAAAERIFGNTDAQSRPPCYLGKPKLYLVKS